eukprot:9805423-Alexandrium_andersonii.AAC.1
MGSSGAGGVSACRGRLRAERSCVSPPCLPQSRSPLPESFCGASAAEAPASPPLGSPQSSVACAPR